MRKIALYLIASAVLISGSAQAATKAPKKNNSNNHATLGTTQLNGNQAQIGATYTLGKTAPINITVNSIEYLAHRVKVGDGWILPKASEKIMVIHYTMHNPNKNDYGLAWSTLGFTAVDSKDKNWKYCSDVSMEDTGVRCNMSLKPAQKTKLYTAIVVPADLIVPKLIIESRDHLVLRYDLKGKVKPIPAPFVDTNDKSGEIGLTDIPAQIGTYYPTGRFDTKLDSVEYTDSAINGRAPKRNSRYLVFKLTLKNSTDRNQGTSWHTLDPKLTDQDGAEIKWNGNTFLASRDENLNVNMSPGQETRIRHFFEVPNGVTLKSFSIKEYQDSRSFTYDVSNVQ